MSDSEDEEMLQYKIILLGDGTVGKTSIAMRFTNDTFGQAYKQVAALSSARTAYVYGTPHNSLPRASLCATVGAWRVDTAMAVHLQARVRCDCRDPVHMKLPKILICLLQQRVFTSCVCDACDRATQCSTIMRMYVTTT